MVKNIKRGLIIMQKNILPNLIILSLTLKFVGYLGVEFYIKGK